MIPRKPLLLLHIASAAAICTNLSDCQQYAHLKTAECQPYHHFLARGSTSPYPGHLIETVGKVCERLNNKTHPNACGYEDVEYAAQNGGERWCQSAHEGALNAAAQMQNYTQRCPDSRLIVMGFSQGGSVQLDVLGGGGGELWGCMQDSNPGLDISSAPGSKSAYPIPILPQHQLLTKLTWPVAAALIFGATRRSSNQTWTRGGGSISDGVAPRTALQNAGLAPYADAGILREYCQPHDPICAPHTNDTKMSFHLDYFDKWGDEAAAWVVGKVRQDDEASSGVKRIAHPVGGVFILLFMVGLI
jgi:acetylxylan esterase